MVKACGLLSPSNLNLNMNSSELSLKAEGGRQREESRGRREVNGRRGKGGRSRERWKSASGGNRYELNYTRELKRQKKGNIICNAVLVQRNTSFYNFI